jgi:hypothetical protein
MNNRRALQLAALLCVLSAGRLSADSGAKIAVSGGTEAVEAVAAFEPDVKLFTDRTYAMAECPEMLRGKKFLRVGIDAPEPWPENTGELLYNGVRLPAVWPPEHLRVESVEPMPVPYLDHPPMVIPIDVGRQLLVDDFLVESTDLKRTFHRAEMTCWMHVASGQRPRGFNHSLQTSADGRQWSAAVPTGLAEDYCSFFYNPFRRVWVYSIKQGGPRGRCRYYAEHADFMRGTDFSPSVYWTNADRLDEPEPEGRYPGAGEAPQLYSLNAVAYESLLIGMHYIHRGPNNAVCAKGGFPKLTDLELGFSRDGFHWHRPERSGFIAGTRRDGDWDRAYLHGTTGVFVLLDDQLVFPYTAFSGIAPDGSRGMYHGGSIGIATLRRDGFASLDADARGGTLTTRPVTFSGRHLFVNVDCPQGELRAEILDADGKLIEPYASTRSKAVSADHTR